VGAQEWAFKANEVLMKQRSFFPSRTAAVAAGILLAGLLTAGLHAQAQNTGSTQQPAVTGSSQTTTDAQGRPQESVSLSANLPKKKKTPKTDRVQQTKDTRAELKKEQKYNPLIGKDATLPDKQLYDKALAQENSGHYDVARLDLQTLLNTYPDSQYQMRAKLAVADSWYKEGGSAALAQAEQEYNDFITFFPNSPEASEAQMRVGDIYFKQMDVPDRDSSKGLKAEEAYRTMLKQYPDAPPALLTQVKQKLREVQEVEATREALNGQFYATHMNWPASIARFQTVVDTYPQYSHMDDVLIGIGDGYEAQARIIRTQPLPEGAKAKLLEEYEGKAADAYRKVVLEHAAAPHVEDAKERLAAMNLPIPTPTPEQVAASEALEGSRAQYTMAKRLKVFFMHEPDMVTAAQAGDPPLEDPAATTAPMLVQQMKADYYAALNPGVPGRPAPAKAITADGDATPAPAAPAPAPAAAPLAFGEVPTAGGGSSNSTTTTMEETAPAPASHPGNSVGVEVLTPGATTSPASNLPAATGAQDPNNGLSSVGPKNNTALPPVEKVADAPDQVNDVAGQAQPTPTGTASKPAYDKGDESSSKHQPKKGVDKLNPF
jgi:outer membrane protein assembly factor BamD